MDKMKGLAKGGWHPSGDKQIHRDTWKTDLKGMATGKKKDPYEDARNHQSAPLTSLRDPDSFGPPPKHTGAYGNASNAIARTGTASSASSSNVGGPSGGWGSSAVEMGYAQKKREQEELQRQQMEEEQAKQTRGPYRSDTTGLRTDNLPKPPVRRNGTPGDTASPARTASPSLPPRQSGPSPAVPPRAPPRQNAAPPPSLPPRQNEYPDEYTPAPPPPYNEALNQPTAKDSAAINQGAAQRLGQAGVNVAGFGIGNNNSGSQTETPAVPKGPPAGQLSELQQRFARMNPGSSPSSPATPSNAGSSGLAGAAQKKAPPPPPPKKAALSAGQEEGSGSSSAPAAPPIPMSSKPKPS